MFDFLFGGKKKLELIRELLEQRMRGLGFDNMEYRLHVKQMSNLQLMGTPEAAIITIVESVFKLQKQGMIIAGIIQTIEDHRKSLGHNEFEFGRILSMATGTISQAGEAIPEYCYYRLDIEQPGKMTDEQFINAFTQAAHALKNGL
jgi:hypothetical protein